MKIFFSIDIFFIQKCFNYKTNIHIYDHFENMPFDNILRFSQKYLTKHNIKNIGYCHSIVSKNYYGYKLNDSTEFKFLNIDRIVTNSKIFTKYLHDQNFIKRE